MRAFAQCPLLTRLRLDHGRFGVHGANDPVPISVFSELGARGLGRLTSIKFVSHEAPVAPGERLLFLEHCSSLRSIHLWDGGMPLLPPTMTSLTHMRAIQLIGPAPPATETRPLARLLEFELRGSRDGADVDNELLGRLQSVTCVWYKNSDGPLPCSLSMLTTLRSFTWVTPEWHQWADLGPVAGLGRLTSLHIQAGNGCANVHVPPVPSGVALPALRENIIWMKADSGTWVELPLFSLAVAPRLRCLALINGASRKYLFSLAHLAQWSLHELRVLCLQSMTIDVGDAGAQANDIAARAAVAVPALAIVHLHDCTVTAGSEKAIAAVVRGEQVCRSYKCSLGRRVRALIKWWL